ncbi:MAG: beta-lactamase family protein [Ruminococcaceae bacterium]|nr:beta-lactamase family protein [Oscillospiraceae bacterium]
MFDSVLQLVQSGVGSAYPCAAVAIGQGHRVLVRAFFGQRQVLPTVLDLTEDTLFDLASLSKLVSTTMVALKMIENGKLHLHDKIGKYLDFAGNFADCEIYHLLTHTSGLPAGIPLYNEEYKNRDVLQIILSSEKCYETGKEVCYSCMGYLVLQRILEAVGGETLDKLARKYVFAPLGMKNACYNPDKIKTPIAATELYAHNGEWATGYVHDENAHYLGGVAGNAGVFATLDDMISFAGMCATNGIAKDGEEYLSSRMFDLAIHNYTPDKKESRGLGFQLKGRQDSPMGELLSQGSYGHTGFTGTSLYVDKDTGLWGILLTNAVHYGRENRGAYFALRRKFYDSLIRKYKILQAEEKI